MTEQPSTTTPPQPAGPADRRLSALLAALVAAVLLVSGVGFRLAGMVDTGPKVQTPPRMPLSAFPVGEPAVEGRTPDFLGYRWSLDEALDPQTEKVLGAMSYINREGYREADRSNVHLWVTYFGQAQSLVEHEPEVCYVQGAGWSLPYGIEKKAVVPLDEPLPDGTRELPVNVYLFEKDVHHQVLVNSYCVDGRWTNSRDEVRMMGADGGLFYSQVRVVVPLDEHEWAELRGAGEDLDTVVYARARDTDAVRRTLAEMAQARRLGTLERRGPYLRAAEVVRYVVPHLQPHWPVTAGSAPADAAVP